MSHSNITAKDAQETHPGFDITCAQCGGNIVYIENDQGYSPESGSWGGVHLICAKCGFKTTISGD